jgi:hypothetical protein
MKVRIEGDELIISIPMEKELKPSSTGKVLIVASTYGFTRTDAVIDGNNVVVNVNAVVRVPKGDIKRSGA